ncbi:MAG: hypothetical protein ACR2GE_14010 [Pseudonocardia sp.]
MQFGEQDILLPTTMVGSWPRPLWLRGGVIRESAENLDYTDMYQRSLYEDAVRLCVKDQDLAGLDIVTDGNQYFEGETPYDKIQMLFVPLRLAGFRAYGPPGNVAGLEHYFRPVVADKIRWVRPIFGPVLQAMKLATDKPFKININSGPATVATGARTSTTATSRRCAPTSRTRSTASCAGWPTTVRTSSSSPSRATSPPAGATTGRWS